MSQRTVRVRELVKREISDILHTRYRSESVLITITDVDVAPDLRKAHVFFSVVGDEAKSRESHAWLRRMAGTIRGELGRRIVLKYLPHLEFDVDPSVERGFRMLDLLDALEEEERES